MHDISGKPDSLRIGVAKAIVSAKPETIEAVRHDRKPFAGAIKTAEVAAALGAKRASEFVPMTHPIPVQACEVEWGFDKGRVEITVTVKTVYRIGPEVEAMTAAAAAALSIVHMTNHWDGTVDIAGIHLLEKRHEEAET